MHQAFSKIWILIVAILIAGGILAWQYFGAPKEKPTQTETTKWKEYILEEITQDFNSPDFMDRRLIGVRDDGQRDIIVASVKELMGWEKTPGETGFYPREVSFPPYSTKMFFVKHLAGTGHSAGFFMLDVKTLKFWQLTEVGQIYENYYNYLSVVSPDGFKIASLGREKLYLLDLLNDRATVLVEAEAREVFNPGKELPDFAWLDNKIIQYPVYSSEKIYDPPIEIRQISIDTKKVIEEETADWKTYRNEKYGFELKYPLGADWEIAKEEDTPLVIQFGPDWCITIGTYGENPEDLSVKNFCETKYKHIVIEEAPFGDDPCYHILYKEPIMINIGGKEAFQVKRVGGPLATTRTLVSANNFIFYIKKIESDYAAYKGRCGLVDTDKIYNQMLSTFRFLE